MRWRVSKSDFMAMLLAGLMIVVAMEMLVWAITGGYIGG